MLRPRWEAAARLVAESRDVLDARPGEGDAPPALVAREWAPFLLDLDEAALVALEVFGHEATWPDGTPPSLRALVDRARLLCDVAMLSPVDGALGPGPRPARRLESPRKKAQVDDFARVVLPLAGRARRVVDVGSGHGHLTREIAERIALPVVGLERDVALTSRARRLSEGESPAPDSTSSSPSFAQTDVMLDGLALTEGDCVIGLHACGELGDAMIENAARCAASVALVGCCLQKRSALSRAPLCRAHATALGGMSGALDLPRHMLGLSNLTAREDGVEATRAENLAAREKRLALHRLLSEQGGPLRLGAEIEGLNRRAAQGELASLVARAFGHRGLPVPSAASIEDASRWAHVQHARVRRLALPRAMLARALEVFVLLDRALYLEERGFEVTVGTLFPAAVSARNLVLLAQRRA